MIAAIYARKSTSQADVADEAKSVTRQVDGAKAFIAAKGWTLDEHRVYTDDGVSGALFANRAEFQRMMRDAEAGAFNAVVFYDLDRFGRNARNTMLALNTLADLRVEIWDYSTGQRVDLDSFEGEMMTFMKARFAQQYRDQVRKHTRAAMRQKAEAGFVTGNRIFGYSNVKVAKGQTTRMVNDAEAAVVRAIYERFAAGDGLRTIALTLNAERAPSPRAQQGRPNGWSSSSVRAILARPLYRGLLVYGRTAKAYGRELNADRRTKREKGQVSQPEEAWVRREVPELRIVDADLAARVDKRRDHWKTKADAAKKKGRAPQNAGGKYLLSGGLLVCPTCGGHFEAFRSPWKPDGVYVCATRRRKPGVCTNTLSLPIPESDDAMLEMVEGEVLGTRCIEELLALVDNSEHDSAAALAAERDRLAREVSNLLDLAASGVSADTLAPKIREREQQIATLDAQLRRPRPQRVNVDKLRDALAQRVEQWKSVLRSEPRVARILLRRLVGPVELVDPNDTKGFEELRQVVGDAVWAEWSASVTPEAVLEGILPNDAIQVVASPTGFEPVF